MFGAYMQVCRWTKNIDVYFSMSEPSHGHVEGDTIGSKKVAFQNETKTNPVRSIWDKVEMTSVIFIFNLFQLVIIQKFTIIINIKIRCYKDPFSALEKLSVYYNCKYIVNKSEIITVYVFLHVSDDEIH